MKASSNLLPSARKTLERIREVLLEARHQALRAVNAAMVQAYWDIGREIIEEEQRGKDRAEYGKHLLKNLSAQLTKEFGKGFDESNLRYIRLFYKTFPIRDALRHELSWTHYRLLSKISRDDARDFYMIEAVKSNWSTRQLERQINSLLFERLAKSKNKKSVLSAANKAKDIFKPQDFIRDPYILEFTGLPERGDWLETDLEEALMNKLQQFLLELGRDFFFVARQKRITLEGDHFYIDLVFYHRTLRCFVLIDLKVGKLSHQDIGQMLMYTGYYEEHEMQEGENPPIGLILCSDKNEAVVRYTMRKSEQKIFAARYQMYLPSEAELKAELEKSQEELFQKKD